jgi:hypothetical protein
MSKYNLTDILNEYVGGGRIGTLNISFRDLVDRMEELERSDKVIVRRKDFSSGDGKVNREFEVVDRDSAVAGGGKPERGFTVYDYKFGFDPGSEVHFMEEYPFSVGGNDLQLAMDLIDGVEKFGIEEEKEEMKENKEKNLINALRFNVMMLEKGNIDKDDFINAVEELAFGQRRGPMQEEDVDEVMGVDRKGRKKSDYKSNLTNIDEADNMEIVTILNNVRKHLVDKFDRRYRKEEFDLYMDSLERDMRRSEKEFDEVKSYSMEDHEAGFEDYIADRYDDIREDFKRFM